MTGSVYFDYLESELVNKPNNLLVTYSRLLFYLTDKKFIDQINSFYKKNRIKPLLQCKQDCDFEQFLSVPSIFSTNKTGFASFVLMYLNPGVSCLTSELATYLVPPQTASALVSNLSNLIRLF
jgi:hypothetical protein